MYAKAYLPIDDWLDGWVDAGYVSEGLADEYRHALKLVGPQLLEEEGVQISRDTRPRRALVDAASDILFRSDLPPKELNEFIIMHTGAAVNMTHWTEVDFPQVPDEWADAVSGTRIRGDLTGQARIDLVREGREGDWIVLRDPEDWYRDVVGISHRAGRNWLRDLWTEQTEAFIGDGVGLKWTQGPQSFLNASFAVDPETARDYEAVIDRLQVDIGSKMEEWRQPDGSWSLTFGEFKDFLTQGRKQLFYDIDMDSMRDSQLSQTLEGQQFLDDWANTAQWGRENGVESVDDWGTLDEGASPRLATSRTDIQPWEGAEAEKTRYRNWLSDLISTNPQFTPADYDRMFRWQLGELDYEPPQPPAPNALDISVAGGSDRFHVIDGDTIDFWADDGEPVRFRLMGINAPEDPSFNPDGLEAKVALSDIVEDATRITIGVFDTDRYGTTQRFYSADQLGNISENERIFAWLYVDGTPVWDPSVFTADNPRGTGIGGTVPAYREWIARERGEKVS
jgi:hypothetical protein